jgi:hypothetical protein
MKPKDHRNKMKNNSTDVTKNMHSLLPGLLEQQIGHHSDQQRKFERLEGKHQLRKNLKFSNCVSHILDDYNFQKRINARKKNDPCQTDDEFVVLPRTLWLTPKNK